MRPPYASDSSLKLPNPLAPPPPRIIGSVADGTLRPPVRIPRPKGVHTKHLTELERFRVRTLYYDASLSKGRIRQITGYSSSQIRTAVRAQSAAIASNAELPTPSGSDSNTELIQQAQSYFAQIDSMTPGEDCDDDDDDDGDDDGDGGESDDEADDPPLEASTKAQAPSTPSLAVGSSRPSPVAAPARPHGKTFNDLPVEVRIRIWQCVLSASPTQVAPSRSWALAVLPRHPWLELGMSPPHVKLENPPWAHYVDTRHVPATVLTRVNREAKGVVLERCTPILVSRATRESSTGIPLFIWIDRYSDVIHFFGERFRHELFEMAGKSACPELYR
ncbi:hypothetical protein EKO27_g669 [Xylaria grammica]|uniref:Uncharacterized protein n=1 Tax=Xylaria grammica TaxID=363999 RepID=A0A439DJ79_9PEZI|nr:hypothetical protein EKO27_g669 [Xylaria grammica]